MDEVPDYSVLSVLIVELPQQQAVSWTAQVGSDGARGGIGASSTPRTCRQGGESSRDVHVRRFPPVA